MAIADIAPQSVQRAPGRGLAIERRFTRAGVHPYDEIEWELRDSVIPGEGGNVFEQKGVEVPKFWSQTATNVVASKYFRGKLGSPQRETSRNGRLSLALSNLPAGASSLLFLQFQVDPTNVGHRSQTVELFDGTRRLVAIDRSITIFP